MVHAGSRFRTARFPRAVTISALTLTILAIGAAVLSAVGGTIASAAEPATPPHPVTASTPATPVTPAHPGAKGMQRPVVADPPWKDLTPAQQQALAPLATEWDKLDILHKSKWLAISRKFVTMKPDEQMRIQERMRAWAALTPDQRRVARESYARTKKLNTDQKSAQWEQYQQLPEEQKKHLAAEAAKNKIATPPSSQGRSKIVVPPIKSTPKPVLQRSVTPHEGAASRAAASPAARIPPTGSTAAAPKAAAPADVPPPSTATAPAATEAKPIHP